jgi:predicted transcriptional regulator
MRARFKLNQTDWKFAVTKEYAEAVKEVVKKINKSLSEERRVVLVDLWAAIWNEAGKKEEGLEPLLHDGLHFTKRGNDVGFQLDLL